MNAASLPVLVRLIDVMRTTARGPREEFRAQVSKMKELPPVSVSEAGLCAALLASAGRSLLRQTIEVQPEGVQSMRDALIAVADAMQMEFNAFGKQPHYLEKG